MRSISLVFLSLFFIFLSTFTLALENRQTVEENFNYCKNQKKWYQQHGQFVEAFEFKEIVEICITTSEPSRPQIVPCQREGKWVMAGWYCIPVLVPAERLNKFPQI